MKIEIKDLGVSGVLPTVRALNEKEMLFFEAYFKNLNLDKYESNESLASAVHDAMDCLKALNPEFSSEFGTGDYVELTEFDMVDTESCKMILVMLSDSDLILRRLFSVEFCIPKLVAAGSPQLVVRKKE